MVCAPVRRDNPRALARGLSTGAQTMFYLTCTMISSLDLHITEYLVLCRLWYNCIIDLGTGTLINDSGTLINDNPPR